MILKMKSETGWSFVTIPHSCHIETRTFGETKEDGEGSIRNECKIQIWDNTENGARDSYITYDEVYLINDEGKTIERIN